MTTPRTTAREANTTRTVWNLIWNFAQLPHSSFAAANAPNRQPEEEILDYIRKSCTERMEERQVCEYNGMTMVDVTKGVKVGGAIVFFLDVDRMMKY